MSGRTGPALPAREKDKRRRNSMFAADDFGAGTFAVGSTTAKGGRKRSGSKGFDDGFKAASATAAARKAMPPPPAMPVGKAGAAGPPPAPPPPGLHAQVASQMSVMGRDLLRQSMPSPTTGSGSGWAGSGWKIAEVVGQERVLMERRLAADQVAKEWQIHHVQVEFAWRAPRVRSHARDRVCRVCAPGRGTAFSALVSPRPEHARSVRARPLAPAEPPPPGV